MKSKKFIVRSVLLVLSIVILLQGTSAIAIGVDPGPPPPAPSPTPEPPPPSPPAVTPPAPTPPSSTTPKKTTASPTSSTAPAGDTVAPIISEITVTELTDTSALVSWTTTEAADSIVEFGETTNYGQANQGTGNGTSHSVAIDGLSAGTTYHFRVKSKDSAGNEAISEDQSLTTANSTEVMAREPVAAKGLNPLLWLLALGLLLTIIGFILFLFWKRKKKDDDDDKKKQKHPAVPLEGDSDGETPRHKQRGEKP